MTHKLVNRIPLSTQVIYIVGLSSVSERVLASTMMVVASKHLLNNGGSSEGWNRNSEGGLKHYGLFKRLRFLSDCGLFKCLLSLLLSYTEVAAVHLGEVKFPLQAAPLL